MSAASAITLELVVLRANDLERAFHFYTALGLRLTKEKHGNGPEHYACELGSLVLEIYPRASSPDTPPANPSLMLGFRVPCVDVACAAVQGTGASILKPPHDSPRGRRAVLRDPDGHHVEILDSGNA